MAPKSDHITEPGNKKAIDSRELPSVDAHDQRVQADNDTATGSSVKPSPSSMSPGVTEAIAKLLEDGVWPHTHEFIEIFQLWLFDVMTAENAQGIVHELQNNLLTFATTLAGKRGATLAAAKTTTDPSRQLDLKPPAHQNPNKPGVPAGPSKPPPAPTGPSKPGVPAGSVKPPGSAKPGALKERRKPVKSDSLVQSDASTDSEASDLLEPSVKPGLPTTPTKSLLAFAGIPESAPSSMVMPLALVNLLQDPMFSDLPMAGLKRPSQSEKLEQDDVSRKSQQVSAPGNENPQKLSELSDDNSKSKADVAGKKGRLGGKNETTNLAKSTKQDGSIPSEGANNATEKKETNSDISGPAGGASMSRSRSAQLIVSGVTNVIHGPLETESERKGRGGDRSAKSGTLSRETLDRIISEVLQDVKLMKTGMTVSAEDIISAGVRALEGSTAGEGGAGHIARLFCRLFSTEAMVMFWSWVREVVNMQSIRDGGDKTAEWLDDEDVGRNEKILVQSFMRITGMRKGKARNALEYLRLVERTSVSHRNLVEEMASNDHLRSSVLARAAKVRPSTNKVGHTIRRDDARDASWAVVFHTIGDVTLESDRKKVFNDVVKEVKIGTNLHHLVDVFGVGCFAMIMGWSWNSELRLIHPARLEEAMRAVAALQPDLATMFQHVGPILDAQLDGTPFPHRIKLQDTLGGMWDEAGAVDERNNQAAKSILASNIFELCDISTLDFPIVAVQGKGHAKLEEDGVTTNEEEHGRSPKRRKLNNGGKQYSTVSDFEDSDDD